MTWRRSLRWVLAATVVAVTVVVSLTLRERPAQSAPPVEPGGDPAAVLESTGAVVMQTKGETQDFKVEAARQLTYAGGVTKLEAVKVTVLERAGRNFEVTGREAAMQNEASRIDMRGDVRLAASDGLVATTDEASYDDAEGMLRAPGEVWFSRGALSGSGVGATYDRNRDVLWLQNDARITVAPDAAGTGGMAMVAGTAGLARADGYVRMERGVRLLRAGRVIEAETAIAYLSGDRQRVEMIELREGSRVASADETLPGLRTMEARDINLRYGGDGQALQQATLAGDAALAVNGDAGGQAQRITAEWLDVGLAPDGNTLQSLVARDAVRVDVDAAGGTPARHIAADVLEASGTEIGLDLARFRGHVVYQESVAAGGAPRVVQSDALDLVLGGAMTDLREARFSSHVTFTEGGLRGQATQANYAPGSGLVRLTSPAGGRRPVVIDDGLAIEAAEITLEPEGRALKATGDVRTVVPPARSRGTGGRTAKAPALLAGDQVSYVTGADLAYEGEAGRATYSGSARLWQGDTAIQADTIVLDERSGNLSATGHVRSTMLLEQVDAQSGRNERVSTVATADALEYEEETRRLRYDTNAHVNGPQGDVSAGRIELYLTEDGGGLERAEALDAVTMQDTTRRATGTRMTYFARDGRYVMSGSPVVIVEECRETTGKTLTFYRSTDTITVDGNDEKRTQTKAGGKCADPSR